jgi:ribosomal protein L7/L12
MHPLIAAFDTTSYAALGLLVCLFAGMISMEKRQRLAQRRVERKLDALMKHQGVELPSPLSPEVQKLTREPGQKIAAIKLHREQTGLSLTEAKTEVEEYGG